MPKQALQPSGLHKPPTYSHVVKAGNTVYVAGQTAVDATGNVVGKGDIEAQALQVFANLEKALAAAGATFDDVVKMTTYITDPRYREAVHRARQRYLREPLPASTLVVVAGLAQPEYLVEVEVIAVVG